MKLIKMMRVSDGDVLPSRPPRAVNIRSAEGYVGRLHGDEDRKLPKLVGINVHDVANDLAQDKK